MSFCDQCGRKMVRGASFCSYCGAKQEPIENELENIDYFDHSEKTSVSNRPRRDASSSRLERIRKTEKAAGGKYASKPVRPDPVLFINRDKMDKPLRLPPKRILLTTALLFLTLCGLLLPHGSKAPTKHQIQEDIENWPYVLIDESSLKNLKIIRSQTEGKSYCADVSFSGKDEYSQSDLTATVYYQKYDGGKWIIDNLVLGETHTKVTKCLTENELIDGTSCVQPLANYLSFMEFGDPENGVIPEISNILISDISLNSDDSVIANVNWDTRCGNVTAKMDGVVTLRYSNHIWDMTGYRSTCSSWSMPDLVGKSFGENNRLMRIEQLDSNGFSFIESDGTRYEYVIKNKDVNESFSNICRNLLVQYESISQPFTTIDFMGDKNEMKYIFVAIEDFSVDNFWLRKENSFGWDDVTYELV